MEQIKFEKSDGGKRISSFPNEKLDCVVRAYAIAKAISYDEAHKLFETKGRKENHKNYKTLETWKSVCLEVEYTSITLGKFLEAHPYGRFMVKFNNHVSAIIEGVLYDEYLKGPKSKILAFTRVYAPRCYKNSSICHTDVSDLSSNSVKVIV